MRRQTIDDYYFAGEYVAGAAAGCACASGGSVARQIIEHWA